MLNSAIAPGRFNGVAECVSEIQVSPNPMFLFVFHYHRRLDFDVAPHEFNNFRGRKVEDAFEILRNETKEGFIPNHRMLDALGQPTLQFPGGQALENKWISDNQGRLIESTDQILALGNIDSRLSADA